MYNREGCQDEIGEERKEIEKQFRTMKLSEQKKEVKLTCATHSNVRQQRHLLNPKC